MFKSFAYAAGAEHDESLIGVNGPGMVPVKATSIRIIKDAFFKARMVKDRDGVGMMVSTSSESAADLVKNGAAIYEECKVLVMTANEYAKDDDVLNHETELSRIKESGENLVAVAVIAGKRGPLSAARNGANSLLSENPSYTVEQIKKQLKESLEYSNRVLIRD